MSVLKRCPFCGKKVAIASMSDGDEHWFYVFSPYKDTDHCRCRVFMESEKFRDGASNAEIASIRRELVNKWNRRDEK